jgi:hypothetical protein
MANAVFSEATRRVLIATKRDNGFFIFGRPVVMDLAIFIGVPPGSAQ